MSEEELWTDEKMKDAIAQKPHYMETAVLRLYYVNKGHKDKGDIPGFLEEADERLFGRMTSWINRNEDKQIGTRLTGKWRSIAKRLTFKYVNVLVDLANDKIRQNA
jgi:hypothetical protein